MNNETQSTKGQLMNSPTDFDPIEVPDSTRVDRDRTLFITPNGDRSIRLKTGNYPSIGRPPKRIPTEVVIDLTPAALVDALNRIPGFTATYTKPLPAVPTGLGAVVVNKDGEAFVRTDVRNEPWRRADDEHGGPFWLFDHMISEILADGGRILSEGVVL